MGFGRGASSTAVSATKKAKYLGSFVTSECDERVYLPAIVSGLSGSAARSRRVLVEVDERELRVRPRSRLLLLGGASAEPSERTPIDDLCVVHMCVTEPRLIVFVVRAVAATDTGTVRRRRQQQQQPRYRVLVFLCKKPRHARQLLDAASDAKFLADRVADKSIFVVGRQPTTRYESLSEAAVDEGVQPRRQLRSRYYSDSSLCGDNDEVVVDGHVDYGGDDSYRAFELDGAIVDELHPLPPPQQLQQSQQQTWQRRWRRQQQQRHDGVARSPSEHGTLNRGTRADGFWHTVHRGGGGGGGETATEVVFATAPRAHAATVARSRSAADIAIAGAGGRGAATASRGFSRHVSSASASHSGPPRVHEFTAQPSEPPQWVYAKGHAATGTLRAGQTLGFGTTARRTATAALSDGEVFAGSRARGGHYRAASQGAAAAELGWRGGARRSLSSFTPSSGSSDDDDVSSGWTTSDARTTTVTTSRRAATLSSPQSSLFSAQPLHAPRADVYAAPRSGKQRQQQQQQQQQQQRHHHDGASSSYYYASTLPDRTSTSRRQFA